jgi:RNase P protein component
LHQVFTIRKADPVVLASQLNRALRLPREVFQPLIVSVRDSREIVVRARPEVLSLAAAWITENDKEQ